MEPLFNFAENEKSILIKTAPAQVGIQGKIYDGVGEVRLDFYPRAHLFFYGYFQHIPVQHILAGFSQIGIDFFSINNRKVEGFYVSTGGDANAQEFNIKWSPNKNPIIGLGDNSTEISGLIFHLLNFCNFFGTKHSIENIGTAMHSLQHIELNAKHWSIEIKELLTTRKNIKTLEKEGGYRLTHIGKIEKDNDNKLTGSEASYILKALSIFISFAKGVWCEPLCPVGVDESGERVWESWSAPHEAWHSPLSWFDAHHGTQLALLFHGFMDKWEDDDWRIALREAIYWYLNANFFPRGMEPGIILTQAALERLSYEYSVKDRQLLTVEGFKSLRASDKLRLLFSSLGIPIEIPKELPKLGQLSRQYNWIDAPHALTEIRNSLVHPEHKKRGQLNEAHHEARNFGLWYLEMGILSICGYMGTYANRLKSRYIGQVEDVPWKK